MENQEKVRVVIIGGTNIDIQGKSDAPFILADSNPGRIIKASGGVGRNIAENCARLGLSTWLITAFGDDEDARFLQSDCERKGIVVSASLRARAPTARYICAINNDGSLVAAVADMAIVDLLTPEFLASRKSYLDSADYIVADANLPASSLAWLAQGYGRTARAATGRRSPRLFLDTVSSAKAVKAKELTGEFDCMKPNRAEAAILAGVTGLAGTEAVEPETLCAAMASRGKIPGELFISLGEKGIYYYTDIADRGRVCLPAPELRPVSINRSGAGDAACAALVWADARGYGMRDKARYALAAAMLTTASPEPVAPDLDETALETRTRLMFSEE